MSIITSLKQCLLHGNIIDSRDIIDAINFLKEFTPANDDELHEADNYLSTLLALAEEGETLDDWEYGATLVADHYFTDYAKELAIDTGVIREDWSWPLYCIDWQRAARELQQDYTPLTYRGRTYWAR